MKLLLLSDIQGNESALEAVLSHRDAQQADAVVCLGDVACGPSPSAVIAGLQSVGAYCVRGNMDEVIAAPSAPAAEAETSSEPFEAIDRWCSAQLSARQRQWLASRPLTFELELKGDITLLACHGSPRSVDEVIAPDSPAADVLAATGDWQTGILAVGHLHQSMLRWIGELLVLHPGSVGWPEPGSGVPHPGRPRATTRRPLRASFALVQCSDGNLQVQFHTVPYRFEALRREVLQSGMPHGIWYLEHWEAH
ncbi:MAG: metallophosphoesterase family protein [Trueperaceae bacterium]